jgi:uncharacterized membrane protein
MNKKIRKYSIKISYKGNYDSLLNFVLLFLGLACLYLLFATYTKLSNSELIGAILIFGGLGLMFIIASIMYFQNRNKECFRDEIIECDKLEILRGDKNVRTK